jgi:hypothetical protein
LLFVAVLLVVGLGRLFSVTSRMDHMRPRYVGMVSRLLVLSSLVVLCRFTVVAGGVSEMFVCLLVVFGSFFRHFSLLPGCASAGDRCFQLWDRPAKIQPAT